MLIAFPLWLLVLKDRWIDVSQDTKRIKKYSAFYSDISIQKGPQALLWPLFYLTRRLFLAFVMVVCSETLISQLFVMVSGVISAVILNGSLNPFETRFQQRLEYVNEVCLMFVIYPIICFSPFVTSY